MRIADRSATFNGCHRIPPNMVSLDAKIRSAIGQRLVDESNGKHAKSSGFITEHSAAITLMVNVVGFTDLSFSWLNCST